MMNSKRLAASVAAIAVCFASAGVANATAITLMATYTLQSYTTLAKDTIKFTYNATMPGTDLVYSRSIGPVPVDGDDIPVSGMGSYSLTGFTNKGITIDYQLVAVPETATWAMMLVGMGAIGFATRRRQNTKVSYA